MSVIQRALNEAGIRSAVLHEGDDFVELETRLAGEGVAEQPALDRLRANVESVLLSRGVSLDLAGEGFTAHSPSV